MTPTLKHYLFASIGLLFSSAAFAHPSSEHHYPFVQGLWHLISQPDHLLMLLAGITLFWYIKRQTTAYRRNKQKTGE